VDHEAECTYKQLTWDDFRGPIVDGTHLAWIAVTIMVDPVRIEMTDKEGGGAIARVRSPGVYALMNKLHSGAKRGGRTEESLRHEQVHFDLTEYLARRLSREVSAMTLEAPTRSPELQRDLMLAVERRHQETLQDLERLHDQFDDATHRKRGSGALRQWEEKAAELLASEKPYELKQ
jgi:hypothetical protein